MKRFLILILVVTMFIIGCNDDKDEKKSVKDPGAVLHTTLPDVIGGNKLKGYIEDIDSNEFVKYSQYEDKGAIITSPTAAHIRVDGYVKVEGSHNGSSAVYLGVVKNNVIQQMEELSKGSFSKYFYFSEAASDYAIVLMYPKRGSYSYLSQINITNEPSADIQYLVPGYYVQAFDSSIRSLAKEIIDTLDSPTDEDVAKAFHDYIIKTIYYDLDSYLNPERRKDQDALSVINNGCAVCSGYTALYAALLRASGIKVMGISGDTDTGGSHAWNRVYWDGSWHNVDVTWDDPLTDDGSGDCGDLPDFGGCTSNFPNGDNLRYAYFDISDAELAKDHLNGVISPYYKK